LVFGLGRGSGRAGRLGLVGDLGDERGGAKEAIYDRESRMEGEAWRIERMNSCNQYGWSNCTYIVFMGEVIQLGRDVPVTSLLLKSVQTVSVHHQNPKFTIPAIRLPSLDSTANRPLACSTAEPLRKHGKALASGRIMTECVV
jgi:hypothetical protein